MNDNNKMNDNTKMELAREIMNAMIGNACKNGFDENDTNIKKLLEEEKQMNNFNNLINYFKIKENSFFLKIILFKNHTNYRYFWVTWV